jgi:hypothetical protein
MNGNNWNERSETLEQKIDREYDEAKAAEAKTLFEAKAYLYTLLNERGKRGKMTENEIEIHYHLKKDEQIVPRLVPTGTFTQQK